jgi:ABC-type lipoprotein release transport system permease subunit
MRVVGYFVLVAAARSLAVGMAAGVIERRRPFARLRASGLRLGELRQVVFLETAAAMLVTAAVGVGLGLASSYALAVFSASPGRGRTSASSPWSASLCSPP